jgi:hypothetical protein
VAGTSGHDVPFVLRHPRARTLVLAKRRLGVPADTIGYGRWRSADM